MDKDRKLALPLSFTTLLTIVFLAVAALAGAYVWGVMSGRHEGAKAPAPEISAPAPTAPDLPEPDPAILKARELEFAHVLKGEPTPVRVKQEADPPPQQTQPEPVKQESAPQSPTEPMAQNIQTPSEDAPGQSGRQLFDYIFQVAALRDEQAVDSLRQKLEGLGMRTRMERSGKLLLVLILLRGDESRAAEIVNTARELRLGEPLVRSKKPVTP